MALQSALENELFRHVEGSFGRCSIDLRLLREGWFKIFSKFGGVGILAKLPYLGRIKLSGTQRQNRSFGEQVLNLFDFFRRFIMIQRRLIICI